MCGFVRPQIKLDQLVELKYDLLPWILKYVTCCVCSTWHILSSVRRGGLTELSKRVFFLLAEVIGWCWALAHFQQSFPICQVGSHIFSFSFSLIQISSMRTWRWGQMGRATRLLGHPLMRCSHPQEFVWGTEGTDASLQRWDLFLRVADAHCSSTGLFTLWTDSILRGVIHYLLTSVCVWTCPP